jgi:catechol 2,3-dioxygenase-like lactoylglutathione lyase family enzyme
VNRLHVHLKVKDLDQSVAFYTALFGQAPAKLEADYAKWMLEDPRANIAISTRGDKTGVDHVGLQTDERDGLEAIASRLKDAGVGLLEEADATCCYARSNKYWTQSPDGAKWELYHTFADSKTFGAAPAKDAIEKAASPCCGVV